MYQWARCTTHSPGDSDAVDSGVVVQGCAQTPGAASGLGARETDSVKTARALRVPCSTIGLRSGKYADSLRTKHGMDAYNLKGSILAWTHEHLPLTASYDPSTGSAPLPFPSPLPVPQPLPASVGSGGQRREDLVTSRVHVYSDKFALQADGFDPVRPSSRARVSYVLF